jgi:Domain of unknown function (DUF4190)
VPLDAQGRTVSDDGRWYWDGQQWRSVEPQLPPAGSPSYPPQQGQVVYQVPVRTNSMAITSAITGILSYVICPFVGAVVAVITGHTARGQIRRTNEGGWAWATAGLVLGYAHFAILGVLLVLLFSVCGVGMATLGALGRAPSTPTSASAAGIPCDQLEHTQVHFHAALQIVDQGNVLPIPANIGISGDPTAPACFYWLHVHAATPDVIHIEAPADQTYTLGQFFAVWSTWNKAQGLPNEPLDATQVSTLTLTPDEKLVVYIDLQDGKGPQPYKGDPNAIILKSHEVITLEITPPAVTPPPAFTFTSGL